MVDPKSVYEPKHKTLDQYLKRNRYAEKPKEVLTFKMLPGAAVITVIVDMEVSIKRFFGDTVKWSLAPDKKRKQDMEIYLRELRTEMES